MKVLKVTNIMIITTVVTIDDYDTDCGDWRRGRKRKIKEEEKERKKKIKLQYILQYVSNY